MKGRTQEERIVLAFFLPTIENQKLIGKYRNKYSGVRANIINM